MTGVLPPVQDGEHHVLDLKYRAEREWLRCELDLVDLEPALGLDVPMLDFSRTRELIDGAYAAAMEEIPRRLAL